MADQPFVGFYSAILRDLLGALDNDSLRVFLGLASHADERGTCFPGVRQLSAICCMPIAGVFEGLNTLESMGLMIYLRRDERDPVTRKQLPNVYALHPGIVHVAAEVDASGFITISNITKKPDRYYASPGIISSNKNQKQYQKQTINQNHQPEPKENRTTLEEGEQRAARDADHSSEQGQGQNPERKTEKHAARQSSALSAHALSPHSAPPPSPTGTPNAPREPQDLRPYRAELTDREAEGMAMNLLAAAPDISRENARMLTDVYGAPAVGRVLNQFFEQASTVRSPARWIRKMLRRGFGSESTDSEQSLTLPSPTIEDHHED